jgi:hypothetical protein
MRWLRAVVWLLVSLGSLSTTTGYATDVNSEIELLKADVRAEKMAVIAKHMNFTEDQSQAFWRDGLID